MKRLTRVFVGLLALWFLTLSSSAGVSYPDPTGGWSYIFRANTGEDVAGGGSDFDALDGTWSHNNGSDAWDGSGLGGTFAAGANSPGGAQVFSEGGISYLRIQDTGDPRDYGYPDNSNRKVYFGHDITQYGAPDDALDQGITLSFRARIPTPTKTTNPLDPLHRDGQGAAGPKPYPAEGDGYVTSDGGKGNFVIKQNAGGAFAFSLAVAGDQGQGDPNSPKAGFTGLTMNEFNGNVISGNVNFGQGTGTNVLALDPTEWHEFWIVLRKDPANIGTHEALIYVDGSTEARFFKITAGTGSDYSGISYLAMGSTATPQNSALDVDFFAVRTEAVFPPGALANLPPEVRDMSPARGTRYAAAGPGLSFGASTQPPNSIPVNGARLLLNGADVSADVTASGDIRARTFTYAKLIPNQLYTGSIIVSDQAGRATTNAVSFDTFVEGQTSKAELTDFASPVDLVLPSGRHQIHLAAGSTRPQVIRVDQVNGAVTTLLGVFLVPNTGAANALQVVPLSDALGNPVPTPGTGGTLTLRLTQLGGSSATPAEILAVPTTRSLPAVYLGLLQPLPDTTGNLPDQPVAAQFIRGSGSIDAGSPRLVVDGTDVTAQATSTTTANGLSLRYVPASFFAGNSTLKAEASVRADGAPIAAAWSFSVAAVPRLNPSWATPATSVSGRPRGFTGRIHQARADADAALFPNSVERAEAQLANRIIDPDTTQPFDNLAPGTDGKGGFIETEAINYDEFGVDNGLPGDRTFPGLDSADQNYLALEALTYLVLPRGAHRFAVACDDGFAVWAGPSLARATNQFSVRSPGGGTTEVTFDVLAEDAGVYAFRLIYFEGSGGADVEWYTVNPTDGTRTLVNATGGIAAYQTRSGDGTESNAPSPVRLSAQAGAAGLSISWPSTTPAFRLETASSLGGAWTPAPGSPSTQGGTTTQSVPATSAAAFFRLAYP